MTNLSSRLFTRVSRSYADRYSMKPVWVRPSGEPAADTGARPVDHLSDIIAARSHALTESLRWGEPYLFFLVPGVISWMIPLVHEMETVGGLTGGEVIAEDEPEDRHEALAHFRDLGLTHGAAREYVQNLQAWPQSRSKEAADHLFVLFYQMSGWTPMLLRERREQANQQREIAEEIHRRKTREDTSSSMKDERLLLSLIRADDRKEARRLLNRMLGAAFLRSANLVVVRALMIEMMGYLVRSAVEDSPYLEPLLEKNHLWMARIIRSHDFEQLAEVLREALDDFMNNIYIVGYQPKHHAVQSALEHIADHFRDAIALEDVAAAAGLSSYRIAHLIKEHTGKTMLQHVHRLRIQEAQRLLEQTRQSCTEIAYDVGFNDQSYFTKQFRALTGTTPARHRRAYRTR